MNRKVLVLSTVVLAAIILSVSVAPVMAGKISYKYTVIVKDSSGKLAPNIWVWYRLYVDNPYLLPSGWAKTNTKGEVSWYSANRGITMDVGYDPLKGDHTGDKNPATTFWLQGAIAKTSVRVTYPST
jgi:hypothetical protein